MELKAHFSDLHKVIIGHLEQAETEIIGAIAWFTDRDIFDVLCRKAQSGVRVVIALIGDDINQGRGGLNFQRLENLGGQVIFLPPGSRDEPTMHHKFCVIDGVTVINGSYNWSQKARSNDENIMVATDAAAFAAKYLAAFEGVAARAGQGGFVIADTDAARRRLEMIRNLIMLGEEADVAQQLGKLRPVAEALQLERIIVALDNGEYRLALETIDTYLRKATAIVVAGQYEIPRLRLQLEALELRLESITDEKAELERRLITFNRSHDDALGSLIQRVLQARAVLARQLAATNTQAAESVEAEEAERAYEEYTEQHEALQHADPLPYLDEDAEFELKQLYRKSCRLCHPDKFGDDMKARAHTVFVELQAAYRSNDLIWLREIHDTLKAGGLPDARSHTLGEVEALRAAIAELEHAIARLVAELLELQASDAVRMMAAAGATEANWPVFFECRRKELETQLERIEQDIRSLQTEGTVTP
jgi:phospholipase D-like protein